MGCGSEGRHLGPRNCGNSRKEKKCLDIVVHRRGEMGSLKRVERLLVTTLAERELTTTAATATTSRSAPNRPKDKAREREKERMHPVPATKTDKVGTTYSRINNRTKDITRRIEISYSAGSRLAVFPFTPRHRPSLFRALGNFANWNERG